MLSRVWYVCVSCVAFLCPVRILNKHRLIMNTPHSTADDNYVSVVGVGVSAANVADEAAVESNNSPKDESLRPPPDSLKKLTAPETPRWRFVNKAKKTEGYSSSAAGTFVRGAKVMVPWRLVRLCRHGHSHVFFSPRRRTIL